MAIDTAPEFRPGAGLRHLPAIVAGIGCRRGAATADIVALIRASFLEAGLPLVCLAAIATHERKSDEPGLRAAAACFGVPLRVFAAESFARMPASHGSAAARAHLGIAGVAELAALMAGELLLPKRKSATVTCALSVAGPDLAPASQPSSPSAAMASSMLATSSAGP